MQKQILSVEIKNFHAGFVKDGVDMYDDKNVKRDDVEETTDDILQAIVYDTSSGVKLVHFVVETDCKGDLNKGIAKLKRILKRDFKDLDVKVPVQYMYCGFRVK